MNKRQRRYKVALAVERIREVMEFLERYISHASLSSQERRHVGQTLRELKRTMENTNSTSVWITSNFVGEILDALLKAYDLRGEDSNEIK